MADPDDFDFVRFEGSELGLVVMVFSVPLSHQGRHETLAEILIIPSRPTFFRFQSDSSSVGLKTRIFLRSGWRKGRIGSDFFVRHGWSEKR